MNWRAGVLALAVTVLAPVLAGCGGDDDPTQINFPPPQQNPGETRSNVLSVGSVQTSPGGFAVVDVHLVNPSNVAGVQGRILYDANLLELVDPETLNNESSAFEGTVLPGSGQLNYEQNRAPVNGMKGVTFAIGSPTGVSRSGRLFRLWFRPRAGATAGAASVLRVDPNFPFLMAGPRGEVLASNTSEGSIIIGQ